MVTEASDQSDEETLSTLSTFCTLIILRQILTIEKTVLETWHLRHWLQFWRLRTWIQSIIVTWQLIVTLDSIRNSCDVLRVEMSKRRGGFFGCLNIVQKNYKFGDEEFRKSWQSFQNCDWTFQSCDWELRLNIIKRLWLNCDEYLDQKSS